jgi:hypothetical protein
VVGWVENAESNLCGGGGGVVVVPLLEAVGVGDFLGALRGGPLRGDGLVVGRRDGLFGGRFWWWHGCRGMGSIFAFGISIEEEEGLERGIK